jgi:hypothetical protein
MRSATIILLTCGVIILNGCSSPSTNQTSTAPAASPAPSPMPNATNGATPGASSSVVKPKVDACTLLTSDEIKAVQGEAVKETTPSNRSTGDFIVSQCYYGLPTASNSISLTLTEHNSDSKGGQSIKDFWEQTFGKDEKKSDREREKDRDEEKKKPEARREGGEEEESAPMESVRGVGDEAFWSASRVGGALYVLKRDRYLRISVGGKGDAEAKLKKSKTLAMKALRRM